MKTEYLLRRYVCCYVTNSPDFKQCLTLGQRGEEIKEITLVKNAMATGDRTAMV